MAINKIILENFTVFENLEIEFSDGVNVFIGENGTGRTHLLKLMCATLDGAKNSDSEEWTNLNNQKSLAKSYFGTDTKSLQHNKAIERSHCEVIYDGKSSALTIYQVLTRVS